MGKVNRNIRMKAKKAISKVSLALQPVHIEKQKDKLKQLTGKTPSSDKIDLLLHKTNTPKKIISKKEKFRQKHKKLMNKFVQLKKQRKEEKAQKNRQQTAVVGDLKPLRDALPSLDELFRLSKSKDTIKTGVSEFDKAATLASTTSAEEQKVGRKQKLRRKKDIFISKVNSYQAVLRDADFLKNPRDVIAYHIKYTHGLNNES